MELGALVCKPKNPDCINCCLKSLCKFKGNKKVILLKGLRKK